MIKIEVENTETFHKIGDSKEHIVTARNSDYKIKIFGILLYKRNRKYATEIKDIPIPSVGSVNKMGFGNGK